MAAETSVSPDFRGILAYLKASSYLRILCFIKIQRYPEASEYLRSLRFIKFRRCLSISRTKLIPPKPLLLTYSEVSQAIQKQVHTSESSASLLFRGTRSKLWRPNPPFHQNPEVFRTKLIPPKPPLHQNPEVSQAIQKQADTSEISTFHQFRGIRNRFVPPKPPLPSQNPRRPFKARCFMHRLITPLYRSRRRSSAPQARRSHHLTAAGICATSSYYYLFIINPAT